MKTSNALVRTYLYYKDRKQLKTFLTRIGSTISLTPDPPVRAEGGGRGWRPIETTSWEMFLPKTNCYFHRTPSYPHTRTGASSSFPAPAHRRSRSCFRSPPVGAVPKIATENRPLPPAGLPALITQCCSLPNLRCHPRTHSPTPPSLPHLTDQNSRRRIPTQSGGSISESASPLLPDDEETCAIGNETDRRCRL